MVTSQQILDAIPEPDTIRARLTELIREQHALRALLRVAERAERARQRPAATQEREASRAR